VACGAGGVPAAAADVAGAVADGVGVAGGADVAGGVVAAIAGLGEGLAPVAMAAGGGAVMDTGAAGVAATGAPAVAAVAAGMAGAAVGTPATGEAGGAAGETAGGVAGVDMAATTAVVGGGTGVWACMAAAATLGGNGTGAGPTGAGSGAARRGSTARLTAPSAAGWTVTCTGVPAGSGWLSFTASVRSPSFSCVRPLASVDSTVAGNACPSFCAIASRLARSIATAAAGDCGGWGVGCGARAGTDMLPACRIRVNDN
jgi:hypothetical protein